ncbi:hypothetical protein N7468_003021 [Penicillium chermesinum]|uniref:Cytochrome P450 n=1 Tax=Penicillium chermesinum TaxID=63820 RepID=A0A9W9TRF8_9EURO|nr:uncharacterized protein N7468_003021 [Penicillium chermesinum]KAJ5238402.1 hypothetical protein N7468_003021 [Penicillium chermesinum]KAJ6164065.1 hypothetical protein N7470_002737 [Penicillium chermesinum]
MFTDIIFPLNRLESAEVVIATLAGLVFYHSLKTIYRLWFHPLSKFPGPKLAAATSVYEFYYSVIQDGMFPWKIKEMHEIYGPVVRITPHELHFSDPDFYNEIYTGQMKPRDKFVPFYQFTGAVTSAFETHDAKLHNSRRQPLMNVFAKKEVTKMEPLIMSKIKILAQRFERAIKEQTPIQLDSAFAALTSDIISEYGYGRCLEYLHDDAFKSDIRESLLASLSLFHIIRFVPAIMMLAKVLPYKLVKLLNPQLSKVLALRRLILEMTVGELDKLEKNIPSDARLVKSLTAPSIPDSEKTLERLGDEGFVILNAGVTSGKILAFTAFHLLNNDNAVSKKLYDELKEAFPDPKAIENVSLRDLESLPYLVSVLARDSHFILWKLRMEQKGVVWEGLRLALGPLTRLPRTAPAASPLVYKDKMIPPGTGISTSNYFLHMNPELFPNPTEFRPERWSENPEKAQTLQNYIVTFGKGTRHCLGKAYLYMTMAVLTRSFGMELYETSEKDVEVARDRLFGYPMQPSKGVRILPKAVRA